VENERLGGLGLGPLPESSTMPSANSFAECHISDTRQRHHLPSASPKTLGKESTLGKDGFAECQTLGKDMTLGKESPLPSVSS